MLTKIWEIGSASVILKVAQGGWFNIFRWSRVLYTDQLIDPHRIGPSVEYNSFRRVLLPNCFTIPSHHDAITQIHRILLTVLSIAGFEQNRRPNTSSNGHRPRQSPAPSRLNKPTRTEVKMAAPVRRFAAAADASSRWTFLIIETTRTRLTGHRAVAVAAPIQ